MGALLDCAGRGAGIQTRDLYVMTLIIRNTSFLRYTPPP